MGLVLTDSTDVAEAPSQASDLSAVLDDAWSRRPARDERLFMVAVAAALLMHVLPVVIATVGVSVPLGRMKPAIGDPTGDKDGVNVEIIDATEYQRRYVSFTPGKAQDDAEAKQAAPPLRPTMPAEEQREAKPPEPPEPALQHEPQPQPQPRKLTDADIARIMESATLDVESAVAATSSASMATQGQASEYVRHVLRKLKLGMPRSNGIRGTVVIGIVLSEAGQIDWVGVLKTSGRKELDEIVVKRVGATKFDTPEKPLTPVERKIQITYEYH